MEVGGPGLARPDAGSPISPSSSAVTGLSTVTAMSASPPRVVRLTCAPAMLTPASPSAAPTVPTTPGRSV